MAEGHKIERPRSPHHRVVYTNQIEAQNTDTDIRLRFGAIEFISDELHRIEDQVDVILTPLTAMKLRGLLDTVLKQRAQAMEELKKQIEAEKAGANEEAK